MKILTTTKTAKKTKTRKNPKQIFIFHFSCANSLAQTVRLTTLFLVRVTRLSVKEYKPPVLLHCVSKNIPSIFDCNL